MNRTFRIILSVIILYLSCSHWANADGSTLADGPLGVADSLNKVTFFGEELPDTYRKLYDKADSLLNGNKVNINIIHIGGSHVQGGMLTGRLRDNFLSGKPEAEGGFGIVFPFNAARTNTPLYYTSRYTGQWTTAKSIHKTPAKRLGLTGMAITSADTTGTVSIVTKSRKSRERGSLFNSVELYGYHEGANPEGIYDTELLPFIDLDADTKIYPTSDATDSTKAQNTGEAETLAEKEIPVNIYNGSTDSLWRYTLPEMTDSICLHVPKGFTITGMKLNNGKNGLTLNCIGVNGAGLAAYERCADLQRDLVRNIPDMVILEIGINDAIARDFDPEVFKERYRRLISTIRYVNPDCAILFITNNDSYIRKRNPNTKKRYYAVNHNGKIVEQAFMDLGKEYESGVWDLYKIMGGEGSMKKWESQGLARRDKIHFTKEGYEYIADLLFSALKDSYEIHRNGK